MGFEDPAACRALKAKLEEQVARSAELVDQLEGHPEAGEMAQRLADHHDRIRAGVAFVDAWLRMLDLGAEPTEDEAHVVKDWFERIAGTESADSEGASPPG